MMAQFLTKIPLNEAFYKINDCQYILLSFINFDDSTKSSFRIINDKFHFSELINFNNFSSFIGVNRNKFYLNPQMGKLVQIDPSSLDITAFFNLDEYQCYFFIENHFLLFEKNPLLEMVSKPFRKILIVENKIIWENIDFGKIQIFENSIAIQFTDSNLNSVNRIKSKFSKLNYETGQKEWDFDLNDHLDKIVSAYPYDNAPFDGSLQVKEVIGVYKNQLWFAMSNYGLLCLNNTTGEFMHYLRDCPQNPAGDVYLPYGGYPVLPFTENAVLLPDEGKIIVFDSMYYWQLDLETLELDFHFLEDYFKEVDCYTFSTRYKKLIVEGEKIYIVAYRSKKFACFNRRTLKYDWIEPLPEGSGAPRSIEKHGNRLYIDTSKKELLVYELEENEIENNL